MTQEEIIAANKKTAADADHDWAKEARLVELRAEERFGHQRRRPLWSGTDDPDQAMNDLIRGNAESVEADNRRFDEQNN